MSLFESAKEFIVKHVLESESVTPGRRHAGIGPPDKILILDCETITVIRRIITNTDLLASGVGAIQNLSKKRQPLKMSGIYFVAPSLSNMQTIAGDFSDPAKTTYQSCHIFTSAPIPASLMDFVKSQPNLLKRLRTLKEVNFGFSPEIGNIFTVGASLSVSSIYSSPDRHDAVADEIAQRLFSLLAFMRESPYLRFMHGSDLCEKVCRGLQARLGRGETDGDRGQASNGGPLSAATVLVLERSFDPRAAIVHELTFEAMAYDLTDIKDGLFHFAESGGTQSLLLTADDPLWEGLKDAHIADVLSIVPKRLKELATTHKLAIPEGQISIGKLSSVISKYPAFKDEFRKYQGLTVLAEKCMEAYRKRSLSLLVGLEQDYATNKDNEGGRVVDDPIRILPVFDGDYTDCDKVRLAALYALKNNKGMSKELFNKLMTIGDMSKIRNTLLAMAKVGFPIQENTPGTRAPLPRAEHSPTTHGEYVLSRFVPTLTDILFHLSKGDLDRARFPFFGKSEETTLQPGKAIDPGFAFGKYKKSKSNLTLARSHVYVFIIGGVTHSECRALRCIQKECLDCDFFLGSTQILTPDTFIKEVVSLVGA